MWCLEGVVYHHSHYIVDLGHHLLQDCHRTSQYVSVHRTPSVTVRAILADVTVRT